MVKLSMHENLPFDEASTPPRVSTGDLPMHAEIQRWVTEAYERYRGDDSGSRRGLHPRAGGGIAGSVRDRRGRTVGSVVRDRGRRCAVLDPERLQAVRLRPGLRHARVRGRSAAPRREQHRLSVQLADGRRAERRADDEPAGQRGSDRHHQPRARGDARGEVGVDPGTAVDVRGTRAHHQRGGLRLRVGHQQAQPRRRAPAQELRAALLRPRRGDRRLHPPVLPGRDRPRPRGDGGHPGERRREPGHRRHRDQARRVPESAGRDGERRDSTSCRATGSTRSGSRARAASAAAS